MAARPRGTGIILFTFIMALMLSAVPLPDALQWWRPEWVLLVLIYWIVVLPERVGMGTAWILGIMLDVLEGSMLGLNALALTVAAYITLLFYQRIRMFTLVQQTLLVFVLVALDQLITHWIKGILGISAQTLMFLVPAGISAVLWPWLFVLLRGVRRSFSVQ